MTERMRKTIRNIRSGMWLRLAGVGLLLLLLIGTWFRDNLRDFAVDDTRFSGEIAAAAKRHGLDPELVRAVVFQESRFDPFCRGGKGEVGLMQLRPQGAVAEYIRRNGVAPYSTRALQKPEVNLEIGCWYLARAMRRWEGNPHQAALALCQYNAGEKRALRWAPETEMESMLDRISINSTRHYVRRILERYQRYREKRR